MFTGNKNERSIGSVTAMAAAAARKREGESAASEVSPKTSLKS